MNENMKLDPRKTVMLSLDFQEGIFAFVPGAQAAVPNATRTVETARRNHYRVMHVCLGFEPGYPEISPKHPRFAMIKERGVFIKGSDSTKIHKSIFHADDTVIYKHRVSAFAGNALAMILHSLGVENLILFGISTSGIVLSTLRQASDLDFNCTVIKDACFDPDEDVHRVLTEKVFAAQATVFDAKSFN